MDIVTEEVVGWIGREVPWVGAIVVTTDIGTDNDHNEFRTAIAKRPCLPA